MKYKLMNDYKKRQSVQQHETMRAALKYMRNNTTLPGSVRTQAGLQLTQVPGGQILRVKNRCLDSGYGHAVSRKFGLCRFNLRMRGINGTIPGFKKAVW